MVSFPIRGAWALGLALVAPCGFAQDDPRPAQDPPQEQAGRQADDERLEVPEILVTGNELGQGVPKVPIDAVGSRDVFGPERVRETGARDLNDLVQHLPALSTRPYNGGEAAAPSFSMRGLPDDGLTEYVNVMIDGVPASALPYGWTAFSFLPITTERVYALDYLRGGHTVRYSPNTVGGILNLLTEPVPDEGTARVQSTLGSFDYSSTLLTVGDQMDGMAWRATYVDRRGDGYRDDGGFDQQDFNVKARWDLQGDDRWWAWSVSNMESEHQAPGGLTVAQFDMDRFGNARPRNHFEGYRRVIDTVYHDGGADQWFEGFSYVSETARRLDAQRPHFGAPTDFLEWEDESYFLGAGVRAQRTVEWLGMEHRLFGGLRYHGEWIPSWTIHSTPFAGGVRTKTQDSEFTMHTLSAHLDDTFEPVEHLQVVIGARVEYVPTADGEDDVVGLDYSEEFLDVLPGIGASYTITPHWAVYANYFEGFRAPQVWGFVYTNPADDELTFEEGRSMELGTRLLDWRGLSGSVTAWRTEYDDFGVFYSGFYENLGEIRATGVDFAVDYEFGGLSESLEGLSAHASLTLQDSELREGPDSGNEVPYAWCTKAAWRLRYSTKDLWVASLGGVMVGSSYSDDANTRVTNANGNLGRNSGWTLWDLQVSKTCVLGEAADLRVAAGVTNLFDREWEVHSRGGFFGGGLVSGAPRQLYASLGLTTTF